MIFKAIRVYISDTKFIYFCYFIHIILYYINLFCFTFACLDLGRVLNQNGFFFLQSSELRKSRSVYITYTARRHSRNYKIYF